MFPLAGTITIHFKCITLGCLRGKNNSLRAGRVKTQARHSPSWDFSGPHVPYQENKRAEHDVFAFLIGRRISQPLFTNPCEVNGTSIKRLDLQIWRWKPEEINAWLMNMIPLLKDETRTNAR